MQRISNPLSQRGTDARHGLQFRHRCVFNALTTPKMTQQGLQFLGTQPLNTFQRVGQSTSTPSFSVKRVDKTVGFVPGMDQHASFPVQHERIVMSTKNRFFSFGQGCEWKPTGPTVLFQGLFDR